MTLEEIGKKDIVTDALAFSFVAIYAFIQVCVIYNPGSQDDIISARVQDIVMLIIGFYFGNSKSKGGQQ